MYQIEFHVYGPHENKRILVAWEERKLCCPVQGKKTYGRNSLMKIRDIERG